MKNYTISIITSVVFFFLQTKILSQNTEVYVGANCRDIKFPLKSASSLFYDQANDKIYASGNNSIYSYDPSLDTWSLVNNDTTANIQVNASILSIYLTKNGVFYAGTDDRTQSYVSYDRGRKWRLITYPLIAVHSIYEHSDGTIYFGSSFGLYKTTDSAKTITKLVTPFTFVNYVTSDFDGNLLVGTTGLYRSKDSGTTWERQPLRFPGDNVDRIVKTKAGYIYATSNNDITRSTDKGKTWSSIASFYTKDIVYNTSLAYVDNEDYVYFRCGFSWGMCVFINSSKWYKFGLNIGGSVYNYVTPLQYIVDSQKNFYAIDKSYYSLNSVYKGKFVIVGIDNSIIGLPDKYQLNQNYPNPFNPVTTIEFTIPQRSVYNLSVYNTLGQLVKKIDEKEYMPGNYKINFDAEKLTSGMYIYQLRGNNTCLSRKMMLLK